MYFHESFRIYRQKLYLSEQLGGSADNHFSAVFKVLDTSDQDGKAQGDKHRLGFGLIYEVRLAIPMTFITIIVLT